MWVMGNFIISVLLLVFIISYIISAQSILTLPKHKPFAMCLFLYYTLVLSNEISCRKCICSGILNLCLFCVNVTLVLQLRTYVKFTFKASNVNSVSLCGRFCHSGLKVPRHATQSVHLRRVVTCYHRPCLLLSWKTCYTIHTSFLFLFLSTSLFSSMCRVLGGFISSFCALFAITGLTF